MPRTQPVRLRTHLEIIGVPGAALESLCSIFEPPASVAYDAVAGAHMASMIKNSTFKLSMHYFYPTTAYRLGTTSRVCYSALFKYNACAGQPHIDEALKCSIPMDSKHPSHVSKLAALASCATSFAPSKSPPPRIGYRCKWCSLNRR